MLELLDLIGRATLEPLWWPVLLWTVVALPLYAALWLRRGATALTHYWARVALLMSLPLSLALGATGWQLPQQAVEHAASATGLDTTVMVWTAAPALSGVGVAPAGDAAAWSLPFVGFGLLTVLAAAAALWRLARLTHGLYLLRRLRRALPDATDRRVQYSALVEVPLTFGWWRPCIVLPVALRNEPAAARLALAHEAVHVRRRDYAVLLTARAVAAVAALHPLVHLLHRDLPILSEEACDAAVLARPEVQAAAYARLLLRFAGPGPGGPAPALAFGRPSATPSAATLIRRIRTMTATPSPASPTRSLVAACTLALLATALTFLPTQSTDAQPDRGATFNTQHEEVPLPAFTPPSPAPEPPATAPAVEDTPPQPTGGMQAIQQIIRYPDEARRDTLQGTVVLSFLVTADGEVSDIEIQQSAAAVIDYEVVRVLLNTDFEPATRDGEAYTADITFPVTFRLQGGWNSAVEPVSPAFDEAAVETTFTLSQVVVTAMPAR
ncbi:MAG: TonB family protein [Bacteroidetes bacterium]|jgi:TonB family protein|nr:TonB family protein [Bacteroidota bacterium]